MYTSGVIRMEDRIRGGRKEETTVVETGDRRGGTDYQYGGVT